MPPLATNGSSVRSAISASRSVVRPGQHAVGGDVGDHVAGTAGRLQPLQGLEQVAALSGPAARRQPVDPFGPVMTSSPMAIRSPCSAMTSAHHSGCSSAAVPMFTRAQPVASARSRLCSSRMPPDSSTFSPTTLVTSAITSAITSALLPRPNAASRSTRWIQLAPASAHRRAAARGLTEHLLAARPALDQLNGLTAGDVDSGQQHQRTHQQTLSEMGASAGDAAEPVTGHSVPRRSLSAIVLAATSPGHSGAKQVRKAGPRPPPDPTADRAPAGARPDRRRRVAEDPLTDAGHLLPERTVDETRLLIAAAHDSTRGSRRPARPGATASVRPGDRPAYSADAAAPDSPAGQLVPQAVGVDEPPGLQTEPGGGLAVGRRVVDEQGAAPDRAGVARSAGGRSPDPAWPASPHRRP